MSMYKVYTLTNMVDANHISVIKSRLEDLGSKLPSSLENKLEEDRASGKKNAHFLSLILDLAMGAGTYALSDADIMAIRTNEFELDISGSRPRPWRIES